METRTLPQPTQEETLQAAPPGPRTGLAVLTLVLLGALTVVVVLAGGRQEVQPPDAPAPPDEPGAVAEPAVTPIYASETPSTWRVVGVRSGGVLNVRSAPGADAPAVAAFTAGMTGIASTGRVALLAGVTWREVEAAGPGAGWVHGRYLAEEVPSAAPTAVRQLAFLPTVRTDRTPALITADYAELYTGEDANRAAREDGVDVPPGGMENDYYIRNNNPRLRELEVAADVRITVLHDGVQERTVSLQEFAGLLAQSGEYRDAPYWLTLVDGVVAAIEQQYRP